MNNWLKSRVLDIVILHICVDMSVGNRLVVINLREDLRIERGLAGSVHTDYNMLKMITVLSQCSFFFFTNPYMS
jgi:hypothetical protein